MENESERGESPDTFGKCTECGRIYTAQKSKNGTLQPVGTDGSCECGNTEFEPPAPK